ncbi:hypothetical protein DRW31_13080 [Shigella dysenteriae]|uniref:Uncharacterized protein n=1 Tax=Shigella dysenteriae TaxID=622 RepID=A0A403M3M6_SHIDY|nr:hypothetical protein [Shigella dysenteriae]EGE2518359.1 hypothetical protein [Shigella dysenteriae]MLU13264.1 hypothetical protein [Shigella dysenteriae]
MVTIWASFEIADKLAYGSVWARFSPHSNPLPEGARGLSVRLHGFVISLICFFNASKNGESPG